MFKDKIAYNAYMKKYMLERYFRIRKRILNLLGNKCSLCDNTDELEIDHIDYKSKSFNIAKFHSLNDVELWAEVSKCQLLCSSCHHKKST